MFHEITPALVRQVEQALHDGKRPMEIKAAFGVGKETIRKIALGQPVGRQGQRKYSPNGETLLLDKPVKCAKCLHEIVEKPCRICETRHWLAIRGELSELTKQGDKLLRLLNKGEAVAAEGNRQALREYLSDARQLCGTIIEAAWKVSRK